MVRPLDCISANQKHKNKDRNLRHVSSGATNLIFFLNSISKGFVPFMLCYMQKLAGFSFTTITITVAKIIKAGFAF
jgi:hypothetical protein